MSTKVATSTDRGLRLLLQFKDVRRGTGYVIAWLKELRAEAATCNGVDRDDQSWPRSLQTTARPPQGLIRRVTSWEFKMEKATKVQLQRVRATRAFRHRGEDIGVDSVLDLDSPTAHELRSGNKAEFVAADTKVGIVPPAKKERPPAPEAQELAALRAQVAGLTAMVEKIARPSR